MAEKLNITDVKNAFKQGATPDETDYGRLIDLATVGSQAAGADSKSAATPVPGKGLVIGKDGKPAVLGGKGLLVDSAGVSVNMDSSTVAVDKNNQLGVMLKADAGLAVSGGIHIITAPGLDITEADGLTLSLADPSGLKMTDNKLHVLIDPKTSGLEFDGDKKLSVKLSKKTNYIESGPEGLALTKEGVAKIKATMKEVSVEALNAAVKETDSGFKKDKSSGATTGSVETQIADALNAAYTGGWNMQKAWGVLDGTVKKFATDHSGKFVVGSQISFSYEAAHVELWGTNSKSDQDEKFSEKNLMAARVNEDGVAGWGSLKAGNIGYNDSGFYAIIGMIDGDGKPDEKGGKFTEYALMVLVSESVCTAVGIWEMTSNAKWYANPPRDAMLYRKGYQDCLKTTAKPAVTRVRYALKSSGDNIIDLHKAANVTPQNDGDSVYFTPGKNDSAVWKKVVKADGLTLDGKLTLTGTEMGTVRVLAVGAPAKEGKLPAASEILVDVYKFKDKPIKLVSSAGLDLFTLLEGWSDKKGVTFTVDKDHSTGDLNPTITGQSLLKCVPFGTGKVAIKLVVDDKDGKFEQTHEVNIDPTNYVQATFQGILRQTVFTPAKDNGLPGLEIQLPATRYDFQKDPDGLHYHLAPHKPWKGIDGKDFEVGMFLDYESPEFVNDGTTIKPNIRLNSGGGLDYIRVKYPNVGNNINIVFNDGQTFKEMDTSDRVTLPDKQTFIVSVKFVKEK